MLELEAGNWAAALTFCQEMALVAAQIQGEGREGAIAIRSRATNRSNHAAS